MFNLQNLVIVVTISSISTRTVAGKTPPCEKQADLPAQTQPTPRPPQHPPEEGIVFLRSYVNRYIGTGYGAIVGNGTLVVTAYHLVFETSMTGRHAFPGMVVVVSPYLGEITDATLLAADQEMDLAVLQVPWKGHPSFELASRQAVHATREVNVISLQGTRDKPETPLAKAARIVRLPVDSVVTRGGVPVQIRLEGKGHLELGWSGCPILGKDPNCLMGVFNAHGSNIPSHKLRFPLPQKSLHPRFKVTSLGPAAGLIRERIVEAGRGQALTPAAKVRKPRIFSGQATRLLLRAVEPPSDAERTPSSPIVDLEGFLTLRPDSAVAASHLASYFDVYGEPEKARRNHEKALELAPNSAYVHLIFGQFLADQGKHRLALEQFQKAERLAPDSELPPIAIAQSLFFLEEFDAAVTKISKAIRRHPNNAKMLAIRSVFFGARREYEKIAQDMRRAVILRPEDIRFRETLASALTLTGRFQEAEDQLRDMVAFTPNSPRACYDLASFLEIHRTDLLEEALRWGKRALQLPEESGQRTDEIEALVTRVRGTLKAKTK